jgi:hypothetical protein
MMDGWDGWMFYVSRMSGVFSFSFLILLFSLCVERSFLLGILYFVPVFNPMGVVMNTHK